MKNLEDANNADGKIWGKLSADKKDDLKEIEYDLELLEDEIEILKDNLEVFEA